MSHRIALCARPSSSSQPLSHSPRRICDSNNIRNFPCVYFEPSQRRFHSSPFRLTERGRARASVAESKINKSFYAKQGDDYWSNTDNARAFLGLLVSELGLHSPNNWYNVKPRDIERLGGRGLLRVHDNNVIKLAKLAFPTENFLPWHFHRVPTGFWKEPSNQRAYVDWLGLKLGYRKPEDWYKVKTSDFVLNDGHSLLVQFGGSPFAILQAAFGDEFHFQPWQFGQVAKNYFDEVANRRVYVDWLVNLVGVDSPSALRYEHFAQNGGGGLLHRYGNSPAKVVASLFGATPQQEIPANAPADLASLRAAVDDLARKLGQSPEDLSHWYARTGAEVLAVGGSLLHRYDGSLSRMLAAVYPEYDWQPWKFKKHPQNLLRDETVALKLLRFLENSLQIKEPRDWYRVSLDQLRDLGVSKLFRSHGLVNLLRRFYPDVAWNEQALIGKGYKRAAQRWLGVVLRDIWPSATIAEEYTLTVPDSERTTPSRVLSYDYYLPDLKLAVEYQGQQHYEQLPVYGAVDDRMARDQWKLAESVRRGITLLRVPYWWDMKRESLLQLLAEPRPDLHAALISEVSPV